MDYYQNLEELQSMFQGFDQETIKSVFEANNGNMDATIEDLLKMVNEAEEEQADLDDDNLFADPQPKKPAPKKVSKDDDLFGFGESQPQGQNFEGFGGSNVHAGLDEDYVRRVQEQEDAELAYRLQKQYLAQEEALEQQERARRSSKNQPQYDDDEEEEGQAETYEFSHGSQNKSRTNASGNKSANVNNGNIGNTGNTGKKMFGFMNKVKEGFNKGITMVKNATANKPTQNKQKAPAANTGAFSEIDNLDAPQQEVYNFSNTSNKSGNKSQDVHNSGHKSTNNTSNSGYQGFGNNDDGDEVYNFSHSGSTRSNMGLQQLNVVDHNQAKKEEPMHLSDILNSNHQNAINRDIDFESGSQNAGKKPAAETIQPDYFNF